MAGSELIPANDESNPDSLKSRAALPYHFLPGFLTAPQQERFGTGAACRFGSRPHARVLPRTACDGQCCPT